jgi:hypothetical protein
MLSAHFKIENGMVRTKDEEKIGDSETIIIKAIDGTKVRDNTDIDFTEGGHHYVYDYIPEEQIWIDYSEAKKDSKCIKIHEFVERLVMKEMNVPYDEAHSDFANVVEQAFRDAMKKKGLLK